MCAHIYIYIYIYCVCVYIIHTAHIYNVTLSAQRWINNQSIRITSGGCGGGGPIGLATGSPTGHTSPD